MDDLQRLKELLAQLHERRMFLGIHGARHTCLSDSVSRKPWRSWERFGLHPLRQQEVMRERSESKADHASGYGQEALSFQPRA